MRFRLGSVDLGWLERFPGLWRLRFVAFPEEELPDGAEAAHKVVEEAKNAGVWVFGGGVVSQSATIVATDGTVTEGPYPETKAVIGGFSVVDVPSPE